MASFLSTIAQKIKSESRCSTANILVILPGKRASLFLKQALTKEFQRAIICPEIISAEELISHISGIRIADQLELSIELYKCYQKVYGDKAETFDSFLKWSTLLLQDFNEIDRYLVDSKQLFQNLKDIKEIEEWSLSKEPLTKMQSNYLEFMEKLQDIYIEFTHLAREKKVAYQGLAYKDCIPCIEGNAYLKNFEEIYICGFNALNTAEETIFSELARLFKAKIIWDADVYYLEDTNQEAGQFLRRHLKKDALKGELILSNEFLKEKKEIKIIGAPKIFSQAIACSFLLQEKLKQDEKMENTAVVLADETALLPVLSTIPEGVKDLNVTLEYPMKHSGLFDLLSELLLLHLNKIKRGKGELFYYKELEKVIQNPYVNLLSSVKTCFPNLQNWMKNSNKAFISINKLDYFLSQEPDLHELLFKEWSNAKQFLRKFVTLISKIQESISASSSNTLKLESEIVNKCQQIFNRLEEYIEEEIFENIETFKSIFLQLVADISAPFYGEPLSGLQVMGVLETRTLDFENIILVSANENILPSGKGNNSFIPNDLKRHFHLPTYADKDAIYAYHFFKMIQRAKNICIIYNTESERGSSAEKSRFVSQLILELQKKNNRISIHEDYFNPGVPNKSDNSISFRSSEIVEKKLVEKSQKGFSVSYINNYKDCSLKFYLKNILEIKSAIEVEETIESHTLGQILHKALEFSYQPYLRKSLDSRDYTDILKNLRNNTVLAFKVKYSDEEIREGKNFLAFETVVKYAEKVLYQDKECTIEENKSGSYFCITELEKELSSAITVNVNGASLEVRVIGTCDRIEKTKYTTTITDYKSSVNPQTDKFTVDDIALLFTESSYNKALQLLLYGWLAWKNNLAPIEEIKTRVMALRGGDKITYSLKREKDDLQFSESLMQEFEIHLTEFIERLFNHENKFIQTMKKETCKYCDYNRFCNRAHEG